MPDGVGMNIKRWRIASLPLIWFTLVAATIWDTDTLSRERARHPLALELITGKYISHSPEYYKWVIEKNVDKLKTTDDQKVYDDIAVAYSKTSEYDKAINIMMEKEGLFPGLHSTYANLAQFLIMSNRYDEALYYINIAMRLSPEGRSGRESIQLKLLEYTLKMRGDRSTPRLPLRQSEDYPEQGKALGFAAYLTAGQRVGAINTILEMMRFGGFNRTILLEALGDLLMHGQPERNSALLASRAYLKASYETKGTKEGSAAYRLMATEAISAHEGLILSAVETKFRKEVAEANEWNTALARDEKEWIASGADVTTMFTEKYYANPQVEGEPLEQLIETLHENGIVLIILFWVILIIFVSGFKHTPRSSDNSEKLFLPARIASFFFWLVIVFAMGSYAYLYLSEHYEMPVLRF